MRLDIHGNGIDVTDAIRDYVNSKFERLKRHSDKLLSARVELRVDKQLQKAESNLHIAGKDFHADSEGQDLYAAIDLLADKLDRLIIKHKEKQLDISRRSEGLGRAIDL
ncbi:ribosome hibernation-promoting factor, HPF/YfiA family [Aquilutibacter rugosus]|uniref:ribosome hibernation-promoting factor, HPF/YfiA family n=1 Tax=Aquilutibacter rugosus TaxID=3115820 RepID=UPI002F425958